MAEAATSDTTPYTITNWKERLDSMTGRALFLMVKAIQRLRGFMWTMKPRPMALLHILDAIGSRHYDMHGQTRDALMRYDPSTFAACSRLLKERRRMSTCDPFTAQLTSAVCEYFHSVDDKKYAQNMYSRLHRINSEAKSATISVSAANACKVDSASLVHDAEHLRGRFKGMSADEEDAPVKLTKDEFECALALVVAIAQYAPEFNMIKPDEILHKDRTDFDVDVQNAAAARELVQYGHQLSVNGDIRVGSHIVAEVGVSTWAYHAGYAGIHRKFTLPLKITGEHIWDQKCERCTADSKTASLGLPFPSLLVMEPCSEVKTRVAEFVSGLNKQGYTVAHELDRLGDRIPHWSTFSLPHLRTTMIEEGRSVFEEFLRAIDEMTMVSPKNAAEHKTVSFPFLAALSKRLAGHVVPEEDATVDPAETKEGLSVLEAKMRVLCQAGFAFPGLLITEEIGRFMASINSIEGESVRMRNATVRLANNILKLLKVEKFMLVSRSMCAKCRNKLSASYTSHTFLHGPLCDFVLAENFDTLLHDIEGVTGLSRDCISVIFEYGAITKGIPAAELPGLFTVCDPVIHK